MNTFPYGRRATDSPEHREKLLKIKRENLERLQLQAARYGSVNVPIDLQNAIAQEEADVVALEAADQPTVPSDEVLDSLGPVGQWQAMFRAVLELQRRVVHLEKLNLRWQVGLVVAMAVLAIVVVALAVEVY